MVMGLSLKPEHLRRYADIARLLVKYGRSDIVREAGLDEMIADPAADETGAKAIQARAEATQLADDLEKLGPTFVKLGQLLSTRGDLLPPTYLEVLSRLQDDVEPFPFEEVRRIIQEELGAKVSTVFAEFVEQPIAAASLGQVHRAMLRDGREVAVKVQRPDIQQTVVKDLEALSEIAEFLDAHTEVGRRHQFTGIMEELRKSLLAELDYRQEARHLAILRENLRSFRRIVVPQPVPDLSARRVLTMELIRGHKITALSPVVLLELDRTALADELSRAYLTQILIDGFFHADPHPGNVMLTEDGRLALIDLGMVARVPPKMQELLVKMLLAISEGRGEEAASAAWQLAEPLEDADREAFTRQAAELVAKYHNASLEQISAGRVIMELHGVALENGLRPPREFTMIGKALLNLEIVTRTLDPQFDPNHSIRRHSVELLARRMKQRLSAGSLFNAMLEAGEFAQKLPERLNRILERIAGNELALHVDAIDEEQLIRGLQKIANRITVGLILAALIVGAAIVMQIDTPFKLYGYPGLAIILFAGAALGGLLLVVNILRSDR